MSFTCLKKISGMLSSIFPKDLVLFPLSFKLFCSDKCIFLMMSIHFLYYGDLILTSSHLLSYYFLYVPDFLLKGINKGAFSCFIDLATLYFKGLSSKYIKTRMDCKVFLLLKKYISLFLK